MVTLDLHRAARIRELTGWPRTGTNSKPGSICHAHFLAAMVADYVKKKSVGLGPVFPSTPARMDQTPHAEPAPRTQKVTGMRGNTVVKVKKQRQWSTKVGRKTNQAWAQYIQS